MPGFSKRVFGGEVSDRIIKEFHRLGTGGTYSEVRDEAGMPVIKDGGVLQEVNPDYSGYDLGDKTPFARMWTAVAVSDYHKESFAAYNGEKILINSDGKAHFHPDDDEKSGEVILYGPQSTKTMFFTVNNHNLESYSQAKSPLASVDGSEGSTGKIQHRKQLTNNPLMKPAAGITSISSKTQGALGAIQNTTVNFTVHNRFDFENIFLPYFLKPGSIVCVDLGWSYSGFSLYDVQSQLEGQDINMKGFYNFLYNNYLVENYGRTNSLMGNVVNYDSSVTPDGSFECSIEVVSQNTALLDQAVGGDDDIQFLFTNTINDVIATIYARNRGAQLSLKHIERNLRSTNPIDTAEIAKDFISSTSDNRRIGVLTEVAIKEGIFHQDMGGNRTKPVEKTLDKKITSTDAKKRKINMFIDDATLQKEKIYISYGLFEDIFLNNFVTGVIRTKTQDSKTTTKFEQFPGNDFDHKFDSRGVYVRYDQYFIDIQTAPLISGEKLSDFLIPMEWDESYNSRTLDDSEWSKLEEYSDVKWSVSAKDCKDGKHPNYPNVSVIPLRDVFVDVAIISAAFKSASSVNEAIVSILDALNIESNDVWNLKIAGGTDANTGIRIIDANLLPEPKKDRLVFDVTSKNSIVSSCQLKYSTPKDGLASILAIGGSPGPNYFNDMDLTQFAYLQLLNKSETKIPPRIRSLPYQGDTNQLNSQQEGNTVDLTAALENVIPTDISKDAMPDIEEKYKTYIDNIESNLLDEIELSEQEEEEKDFSTTDAYTRVSREVEYVDSYKDFYRKQLKSKYFDAEGATTIAPILPIELSLTIYGNNYLQIGDYFTVNYLPAYYRNRVFFQVVGIDHSLDPNGWSTTYQTVMRVQPSEKSNVSGRKKEFENTKFAVNRNLDPLSTTTSIGKLLLKDLKEKVFKILDKISSRRHPLGIRSQNVLDAINLTGLEFKILRYEVDHPDSWQTSVMRSVNLLDKEKGGRITEMNYNKFVKFHHSTHKLSKITDVKGLSFSLAVRDALFGVDTVIDYGKHGKNVMIADLEGFSDFKPRKFFENRVSDDVVMVIDVPKPKKFLTLWGPDKGGVLGYTFDKPSLNPFSSKTTKTPMHYEMFIKTLVNKLSGSTQDFDQQFLNVLANNMSTLNDIGVDVELQGQELYSLRNDKPFPIPIRGVYFALSAKKDGRDGKGFTSPNGFEFLDVVSLTNTNFDVFSYMPLPVRLFKEKKNTFDYLETLSKRYSHYKELLTVVE